ncbi:KLTH0H12672p [Lachancea thermotolerans CBS 6340]|uniref:Sterol regulatory element-binding protein cleavage-activating protein n=1 Tax=Lachancea thermotolerans (strain ATCC 56472 / CBS 6340 / NRRL Y-8284) TaxID=559295 RepID=C5E3E2_LACTC|nr:KLTH0H12672p [Lachancea thermotolerans CBS 6340]CAR30553.1 KLTH0H12672p [Lachancea thermotolerans CBS 6340]
MSAILQRITPQANFFNLSRLAVRYPVISIFLPLLILTIIAYPTLSSAWSGDITSRQYLSRVEFEPFFTGSSANLSLVQVWIKHLNEDNILKKSSLIESLALQNRLLRNTAGSDLVEVLQSPFQLWNNSLQVLQKDRSPLKTINYGANSIPKLLLRRVLKVNGFVTSAENMVINILTPGDKQDALKSILAQNVAELQSLSNVTGFKIATSSMLSNGNAPQVSFRFDILPMSRLDFLVSGTLCFLLILQLLRAYKSIVWVKHKYGIALAMLAEVTVGTAASATITGFFFKGYGENNPTFLGWLPITLISTSGLLRLLKETAGSSVTDSRKSYPMVASKEEPGRKGTKKYLVASAQVNASVFRTTILAIATSTFLFPFNRQLSFFFSAALLNTFILQLTFFTSVLSLDYRMLSSNDVLFLKNSNEIDARSLDEEFYGHNVNLKAYVKSLAIGWDTMLSKPLYFCMPYFFYINLKFRSVRSSSSLVYKFVHGQFSKAVSFSSARSPALIDKKSVSQLLFQKHGKGTFNVAFLPSDTIFALKGDVPDTNSLSGSYLGALQTPFVSSYKFDFYFFIEFIITVVLLSSLALLVLQIMLSRVETPIKSEDDPEVFNAVDEMQSRKETGSIMKADETAFHTKELSHGGHTLDIVSIPTSDSPFIFSLGIDRKLFVWSPLSNPVPPPTEIPLSKQLWPVARTVTSSNGNLTAILSEGGKVACWSRRKMCFLWSIKLDHPGKTVLELFFRKRTIPAFMKNRPTGNTSTSAGKIRDQIGVTSLSMGRKDSNVSVSSMKSSSSLANVFDARYNDKEAASIHDEDDGTELIFVTTDGSLTCIDISGKPVVSKVISSPVELASCKKLVTPRVNDRLVFCDQRGKIYVSTVVNNKWRTRELHIIRDSFNRGQKLMTPATLKRPSEVLGNGLYSPNSGSEIFENITLLLIPFVGMLVLARGNKAELVDAQTGTSIRSFTLSDVEPKTLKVFHDQPTHCRFCGSASVASLSIAYTEKSTKTLVMHTFKLESRTKTSICLRVERDPREIRCLGLESVVEKKHYMEEADCWNVTDNNLIIGLKRRNKLNQAENNSHAIVRSVSEGVRTGDCKLRNRVESRSMKHSASLEYNIHEIWEGWTMTVNGKVQYYKIPAGVNGLLTNRIGPVEKFGAKAIVAAFGNIMKLFYLGREELILATDGTNTNEDDTGLNFVNKRRKRLSERKTSNIYTQL